MKVLMKLSLKVITVIICLSGFVTSASSQTVTETFAQGNVNIQFVGRTIKFPNYPIASPHIPISVSYKTASGSGSMTYCYVYAEMDWYLCHPKTVGQSTYSIFQIPTDAVTLELWSWDNTWRRTYSIQW